MKLSTMNKYIIVSFLEGIPAGTVFAESKWPLHVTLMYSFFSSRDQGDLIDRLKQTLSVVKEFNLVGKSVEFFGPDLDREVTELELNSELGSLNKQLKESFKEFMEEPTVDKYPIYRPHVTKNEGKGIDPGEVVNIKTVSLILVAEDTRHVLVTLEL
jgi:2'-5' RNA ligase